MLVVSSEADEAIRLESDILSIDKRYEDGLGLIRILLALKYMRDQGYLCICEAAQIYRCRGSMVKSPPMGTITQLTVRDSVVAVAESKLTT